MRFFTGLVSMVSVGLFAMALPACGSEDGGGENTGSSGTGSNASCTVSGDCPSSEVCLSVGGVGTCHLTCTAEANACGGSASCEGVGGVAVNVCQKPEPEPSPENPPEPDEEPWLRCASDAECNALAPDGVCASWGNERFCTVVCAQNSQCNPPAGLGGLTLEFNECATDEGDASRSVCLPRAECFTNPTSCFSFELPGVGGNGGSGAFGGSSGFGGDGFGGAGGDGFGGAGGFGGDGFGGSGF